MPQFYYKRYFIFWVSSSSRWDYRMLGRDPAGRSQDHGGNNVWPRLVLVNRQGPSNLFKYERMTRVIYPGFTTSFPKLYAFKYCWRVSPFGPVDSGALCLCLLSVSTTLCSQLGSRRPAGPLSAPRPHLACGQTSTRVSNVPTHKY